MGDEQAVDPKRVLALAGAMHADLPPGAEVALARFGDLFLHWNTKVNLGGRIDAVDMVDRHYRDAMAGSCFVGPTDFVADVGSGGGLPAIPLALLCPRARFALYEPVGKKVVFLRTAVRELGLGARVAVYQHRVVDAVMPDRPTAGFDVATSRATFSPVAWLALGRKLVRSTGRVLVFTTSDQSGCAGESERSSYAPNRCLLVFRGSSP